MNEHELILGLGAVHQERADLTDVQAVRQHVLAAPILEVPQQRSWLPLIDTGGLDTLSALKFVAASVIVALFGGLVLAGLFSTPQRDEVVPAAVTASPTTEAKDEARTKSVRTDILPGVELTVEEIEPGLYRVLHDGKRRLFRGWALTAGMDGSIWGTRDWQFFEVGGRSYKPPSDREYGPSIVAPDGTVWDWHEGEIASFNGKRWKVRKRAEGSALAVGLDGSVWATLVDKQDPDWEDLARFTGTGWDRTDVRVPRGSSPLFVNSGDDIWAVIDGGLHRLVDGEWDALGPPLDGVDVGPDGTIWALRQPEVQVVEGGDPDDWADFVTDDEGNWVFDYEDILMRYDGSEWQEWGPADGVPAGLVGLRAAPDGSLWATAGAESCDGGMFHFDGTTWNHYLAGRCTDVFEVAPDGSLWAVDGAEDTDGVRLADLYVITPEALAATE